jgi:hypothetical protein
MNVIVNAYSISPRKDPFVYPLIESWTIFDKQSCLECGRFMSDPSPGEVVEPLRLVSKKKCPMMHCSSIMPLKVLSSDLHETLHHYAEPFFVFGKVHSMEGPDVECVYWRCIQRDLLYPVPVDPHLDAPEPCSGCGQPTVLNVLGYKIRRELYEKSRGVLGDFYGGLFLDPNKMDVDKVINKYRSALSFCKCDIEVY